MITRLLTLIVIVTLALPITALTPSGDPGQGSWSESAVAAKGKKASRKKDKSTVTPTDTTPQTTPPRTTTASRTVRGPRTQTFINSAPIAIPAGAPGTTKGGANPYPSIIEVSGFANGVITDVDLLLIDFTHKVPEDVDILLSRDDGPGAMVMSDVGRIIPVSDVDLTLDDEAADPMPQIDLKSGSFKPTDISSAGQPADTFDSPAPAFDGSVALSTFDGADPNGRWQVFVMDDASGDVGEIGGWALRITAEVDLATVNEQVTTAGDEQPSTNTDTNPRKKGSKKHKGKQRR